VVGRVLEMYAGPLLPNIIIQCITISGRQTNTYMFMKCCPITYSSVLKAQDDTCVQNSSLTGFTYTHGPQLGSVRVTWVQQDPEPWTDLAQAQASLPLDLKIAICNPNPAL